MLDSDIGTCRRQAHCRDAFTIVEILVGTAVLMLILVLALSIVSQTTSVWKTSAQSIAAFQSARTSYERLTRAVSQATLNTYWEYDDPNNPQRYIRKSELHFRTAPNLLGTLSHAIFFQAPSSRTGNATEYGGLERLLNGCGFFISFGPEEVPGLFNSKVKPKNRFRLMQWVQKTEDLQVYAYNGTSGGTVPADDWFKTATSEAVPVGDNIIALVLWPKLPDTDIPPDGWTDSYEYDSRAGTLVNQPVKMNQMPPILNVVMVAIDNRSAERLGDSQETTIKTITSGLFGNLSGNNAADKIKSDLNQLEERLRSKNIDYRVFESSVLLRESKWSK